MRTLPALTLAAAALTVAAPGAHAQTGGASMPSAGGGVQPGTAVPSGERPRRTRRPVLASFRLRRTRLFLLGHPSRVTFRIDSRARKVRARLVLRRPGERRALVAISLGEVRTRRTLSVPLTGREDGTLPQGRYVVGVSARDRRGRRLRRAKGVKPNAELSFIHHRFPLVGAFSYGGAGSRFGAGRKGHTHQGQDLSAPEGTPVVAPRGGRVSNVAYQATGAGHYVVLDASGEDRDYVFMHLRTGSIPVREGQRVRTGQRLGEVGNTGRSFGAHLHFELWRGTWFGGGRAVDPLPYLRAWDTVS